MLKNYQKYMKNFSILIGYITIVMELDSYSDVKDKYKKVLDTIKKWITNYHTKNNFDDITYEESLETHNLIEQIREQKIFDKNIGNESELSDEILIWYEVIVKNINGERKK